MAQTEPPSSLQPHPAHALPPFPGASHTSAHGPEPFPPGCAAPGSGRCPGGPQREPPSVPRSSSPLGLPRASLGRAERGEDPAVLLGAWLCPLSSARVPRVSRSQQRYLPSTCTDVLEGGGEKAAELVPTSRTGGDGKQPGTRSNRLGLPARGCWGPSLPPCCQRGHRDPPAAVTGLGQAPQAG